MWVMRAKLNRQEILSSSDESPEEEDDGGEIVIDGKTSLLTACYKFNYKLVGRSLRQLVFYLRFSMFHRF